MVALMVVFTGINFSGWSLVTPAYADDDPDALALAAAGSMIVVTKRRKKDQ